MTPKNQHVSYIYLMLDTKSFTVFTMANDNIEWDYSEGDYQILAVRVINWGEP